MVFVHAGSALITNLDIVGKAYKSAYPRSCANMNDMAGIAGEMVRRRDYDPPKFVLDYIICHESNVCVSCASGMKTKYFIQAHRHARH